MKDIWKMKVEKRKCKENPSTEDYAEVGQNLHDAFSKIGNIWS